MLLWAGVLYSSAIYFCMVGFVAIIVFDYMQYFLPQTNSLSVKKKSRHALFLNKQLKIIIKTYLISSPNGKLKANVEITRHQGRNCSVRTEWTSGAHVNSIVS